MTHHETQVLERKPVEAAEAVEFEAVLPAVNIFESEKEYVIEAEMPGIPKENLGVEIVDDHLLVTGRPDVRAHAPEGYRAVYAERGLFEYRRAFSLNADVKRDGIRAAFDNGVLTLTLPKTEQAQPRRIAID
jgi:HSP20 family protein